MQAIGVTIVKKIIPIIKGDIKLPKIIPNLYQSLFSGFKILEFNKPKNKNINETIKDQTLRSPASIKGHKEINKKTIKKTIPKFLFVGNFILSVTKISYIFIIIIMQKN